MPRLEVQGLCKRFEGRNVLDDITFTARPGDVMAVIGPSGCGKTTLFRCILGELEPEEGRILLDGVDVTVRPVEKRGVGIVYQSYALFPHLTVAKNIAYGLQVARVGGPKTQARVKEMLDLVQLAGKSERFPRDLSGGERQRVALARALAVQPRVLLLDEAFAALDPTTRSEVVQQVRDIIKRLHVTTLLITHDQEEAFLFARRVLVLNEGRIVTIGDPDAVMAHPHPFVQGFVKMMLLKRSKVEVDPITGESFVTLEGGQRLPIHLPRVQAGDEVHVMVKKGPQSQSIEVWPSDWD
ncbi:MAG: ABC transporter ATP-binding protein [Candidatus Thermoplasmatota archaeon]